MDTLDTFLERHSERISGVISCFDRVVIIGSFMDICLDSY